MHRPAIRLEPDIGELCGPGGDCSLKSRRSSLTTFRLAAARRETAGTRNMKKAAGISGRLWQLHNISVVTQRVTVY
jgi:hypothetical protein